ERGWTPPAGQPPPVGVTDAIREVVAYWRSPEGRTGAALWGSVHPAIDRVLSDIEVALAHQQAAPAHDCDFADGLDVDCPGCATPTAPEPAASGEGLQGRIAQAIADAIGHRMAEKCEPH